MPSSDVIDDDLPRPFGAYLLLQNFARGGMGEVFLAKSGGIAGLERVCVVKKLRAELTGDREYVTRFVDEARVVVTLNHANICSVFDVGRVASRTPTGPVDEYYLAMEYIAGRDVRSFQDRCRKHGIVPDPVICVHLVGEVLKALDYAHRRRHPVSGEPLHLVHRDISPQNVLVSYEGEVKLIDFGLAASRLKVERTQPNVVMGKMAYMPPEQARGDAIDSRADLFACGVMLYELLANERYYEGMSANDIWQVAGRGHFVPRGMAGLDPALQGILGRALHQDPNRRLSTCGEFRELLQGWAATRSSSGAERVLRELMERLFVDEIARERATMARFGSVTVAAFRGELESTNARVVNLAGSGGSSPPVGAGIHEDPTAYNTTRPARSTEEGKPPGASSQEADPTRLDVRPPGGRIHDEKTMVTSPSGRTLPAVRPEHTQLVRRRPPATVEDDDTDGVPGELTAIDIPARRRWLTGAVIVAVLLVGLGLAVARGGDDLPPSPPLPPTSATATAPTTIQPPQATIPAPTPGPAPTPPTVTPTTPVATRTPIATPTPTSAPRPTPATAPVRAPPPTPAPEQLPAASLEVTFTRLLSLKPVPPCVAQLIKARGQTPPDAFFTLHGEWIRTCAAEVR